MKANELMIADWVSVQGAGHAQVVMVDQYYVVTTLAKHLTDERKLEAIAITAEILEANGFEKVESRMSNHFRFYYNDSPIYVESRPNGYWEIESYQDGIIEMAVRYVHQLQHLFRLQGCIDLADNLKINGGGQQ